jgi:hypothetical protein
MKTNLFFVAIATVLLGLVSCSKDENGPIFTGIDASKTSKIKKGEPVIFKFSKAPEGSIVQWKVLPDKDVQINASGNSAAVLFGNAGLYNVSANYGTLQGDIEVSVQDSIYNPGSGDAYSYEPLTGDQIFITVTRLDSMGVNGLDFRYITEKKYPCLNHTLIFDNIFSGDNLKVDFKSVFIPAEEFCTPGEDYASSGTAWYPIAVGYHVFEVVLDGTTYTGSFIKAGSTYTFTWPYTSGVTLTPLVID